MWSFILSFKKGEKGKTKGKEKELSSLTYQGENDREKNTKKKEPRFPFIIMCFTKRLDLSIFFFVHLQWASTVSGDLVWLFLFWWFYCKAPQCIEGWDILCLFFSFLLYLFFCFFWPSSLLFSISFNLLQNFSTFWYTLCQSVSLWFSSPGIIAPIANNTLLCFAYNNNSNEWKFSKCYSVFCTGYSICSPRTRIVVWASHH